MLAEAGCTNQLKTDCCRRHQQTATEHTHTHTGTNVVAMSQTAFRNFLWSYSRSLSIRLMTPWGNWLLYVAHMDLATVSQLTPLTRTLTHLHTYTNSHTSRYALSWYSNKFIEFPLSYCNSDLHGFILNFSASVSPHSVCVCVQVLSSV